MSSPATAAPGGEPPAAAGEVLTLLTGDQVALQPAADGRLAATIEPAPRSGQQPAFETIQDGEDVYVLPSDAVPLIPDQLDRELFNVTKLARYGYTDGIPVLVTQPDGSAAQAAVTAGMSVTTTLPSIGGYAATVAPDGSWWRTSGPEPTTFRSAGGLSGVEKVWLDELHEVALAESGPLVGAPEARAAGFDGTGMTIAVLDTGIDGSHPDLAGRVVAAENFTGDPDASDEHGHGTHVSGIAAGTGAASDGTFTGMATGAELLNGKICNSGGSCPTSGMLAGMEWAAPQADVISLSVGTTSGSDGTDLLSQAVNTLTAQHDTLFVIAAGNSGVFGDGSVGSPGAADAALTVGSVNKNEQLAGSSSRGPRLGDFAIKPDLTAPGVSIVSARGAGTGLGTPVDDFYTTVSGTSMATPHVSGAAAILLQQDPDLSAAELKAALAATAVPHPDLEVYQQGGGRLDIPAALDAPVRATPAPLNLGYFQFPHDNAGPAASEVTYTNRTDEAVTLDLTLDVASRDGAVPPEAMLSVTPATLTVPAQGTATATVTLDVSHGEIGLYGGYLVANRAGDTVTRTPVGFFKEQEMYNLSVQGFARDGRPARGSSSVHVGNVHDVAEFLEFSNTYVDGVASVRVPPGTYHVMGITYTYDGNDQFFQNRSMVGVPELEVTEDTTIVLDAREANPVEIATPRHEQAGLFQMSRVGFVRQTGTSAFSSTLTGSWLPTFAMETDPVTIGGFEFFTRARLGELPLTVDLVDPVVQELHPRPMLGTPPLDGELTLPVVWAGFGAPEDYQGLDVEGAAVLTMRGGPGHADKEATARANGAAALLVMNNAVGNYTGSAGSAAEIHTMTIPGEEGELIRDLLDQGDVSVRLAGTSVTPFLYDVVFAEPDRIPAELSYVADANRLATLDNAFHVGVPDHEIGEVRHSWRPWESISIGLVEGLPAPQQRTEYLSPGDTRFRQQIDVLRPFVGTMIEQITSYQDREQRDQSWFESPVRPGVIEGTPQQGGIPVVRDGDTLDLLMPEWVDTTPRHWGFVHSSVDTSAFRLFQDGELIAEAARANGDFPLSPDPATYRMELDVNRDAPWWTTSVATRSAWTFASEQPSEG
ncbi:MAG: S8 family serine peptidase, partial [Micromonosporaceae bacterium]|nr:S8 family serine peptidase [Micromonosporaceae bacterium]